MQKRPMTQAWQTQMGGAARRGGARRGRSAAGAREGPCGWLRGLARAGLAS